MMVDYQQQHTHWENIEGQRLPDHDVSRLFSEQRWAYLERHINLDEVNSVLDAGAGLGVATYVKNDTFSHLVSSDFSYQQVYKNISSPSRKLVSDAAKLPFSTGSFDLVTVWEVLHHVPDPVAVITEMARVSKRWIVIFEPNPINPVQFVFSSVVPAERGTLSLHSYIIEDALKNSQFVVRKFEQVGLIFPNKSPLWFAQLLSVLPFTIPLIGISRLWIAERSES